MVLSVKAIMTNTWPVQLSKCHFNCWETKDHLRVSGRNARSVSW